MIQLEHTEWLYALGVIPVLSLLFWWMMTWRRRAIKRFGEDSLVLQLIPDKSKFKHHLKFGLLMLGIVFLVIGIANPQIGTKMEKVKRQGVDVVIAMDVSRSMTAEDLKPNRLARSRQFVSKLIDRMQNDRVAIIVFAGNAYLQLPLTVDYAAAKMFLKNISTNIVPSQGTNIGEAIKLAMRSFEAGENKHKSLIIITDGENHDDEALKMAELAAEDGVVIHTVGIGTYKGAPIPVYRNGVPVDYKKDKSGSIVLSKLNEAVLQQLAVASNGQYYHISGGQDELTAIMGEIASIEKKEFEERIFTDYDDKFQYFLGAALFFLFLEFFISYRRNKWLAGLKLFQDVKKKRA